MLARWTDDLVLAGPWKRAGLALLVGALSALGMAPLHWGFVLFATIPILVFLLDGAEGTGGPIRRAWPAFATGWCFGFGYFVAGLWWIGQAFLVEAEDFAYLLPLAVAGLPAVLAIFHGLAAIVARVLSTDGGTRILALAFAFAGAEWLRSHLFTGFPWNALGYAALPNPVLMQPAALWGIYGVTFVALLVFASPALLVRPRRAQVITFALVAVMALGHLGWSAVRWTGGETARLMAYERPAIKLRLVQPAVDQREKWADGRGEPLFRRHVSMSKAEPLDGLTYVIWPESAFAFLIQREPNALSAIADLLPDGVTLITGGMRGEMFQDGVPRDVWNSVLVIDDEGTIVETGDKTHLVPFGEYLPFQSMLEAIGLQQLTGRGAFEQGAERLVMQANVPGASFLPLVCYEVIFSGRLRTGEQRPAFLLNLTNDAWFGMTPGPYQHAHQAVIRGVEEGLPMVRVANSGISLVSGPYGRKVAELPLGGRDTIDAELPSWKAIAPFRQWGEWPFWLVMATSAILLIALRLRDGKRRRNL